jgi:hypothetical protein
VETHQPGSPRRVRKLRSVRMESDGTHFAQVSAGAAGGQTTACRTACTGCVDAVRAGRVRRSGTGPPLLAIHGVMGGWSNTWCLFHPSPVARKAPEPARRARPPSREDELRRGGVPRILLGVRTAADIRDRTRLLVRARNNVSRRGLAPCSKCPLGWRMSTKAWGPVGYSGNACTPRALPVR